MRPRHRSTASPEAPEDPEPRCRAVAAVAIPADLDSRGDVGGAGHGGSDPAGASPRASSGPHRAPEAERVRGPETQACPAAAVAGGRAHPRLRRPHRDRHGPPPAAGRDGAGEAPLLDALFTATSAVCVTGLVVVDTATYWSPFGQAVDPRARPGRWLRLHDRLDPPPVRAARSPDRPPRPRPRAGLDRTRRPRKDVLAHRPRRDLHGHRRGHRRDRPDRSPSSPRARAATAAWSGIFHSISAFNNAGFDLTGDFRSLTGYADDPLVLLAIAVLFILGALGFASSATSRPSAAGRGSRSRRRSSCSPPSPSSVGGAVVIGCCSSGRTPPRSARSRPPIGS